MGKVLYLMGAGRSGTTMLASVLGAGNGICTIGEMHQFLDHYLNEKPCSCGETLPKCQYWGPIVGELMQHYTREELIQINRHNEDVESHANFFGSLFKWDSDYATFQANLFGIIQKHSGSKYVLDSSKYVSKALQFNRVFAGNFKAIYLVRDVRGVINSFSKQVQTPKSAFGSVVYYMAINGISEIARLVMGSDVVLKMRYEDFVSHPDKEFERLKGFLGQEMKSDLEDIQNKISNGEPIPVPHIVGGNRLKRSQSITLRLDNAWREKVSRGTQIWSYLISLPFMWLNGYKL